MMTPDNLHSKNQTPKEDNLQSSQKTSTTTTTTTATAATRPQEQALKCPRCDSPNTKFCYYNNYSLSQPRHFCKTCRRYWTNGGALRNVPIGGGCRKNKKMKSSSSSSRLSCDSRLDTSDHMGGLKFLHGLSPTVDFSLTGLSSLPSPIPTSNIGIYNHFSTFPSSVPAIANTNLSGIASSSTGNSILGFNNYPLNGFSGSIQEMGSGNSINVNSNLASSIESLSCINQDLHWKLQQKRLGMIFGTGGSGEVNNDHEKLETRTSFVASTNSSVGVDYQHRSFQSVQKPQPILFHNLDVSRPAEVVKESDTTTTTTEWLFGNSYTMNSSNNNLNGNANLDQDNGNNWNGSVQAWSGDLHQYNALP